MPAVCFTQTCTVGQMDAVGIYWPEAHQVPEQIAGLAEAAHTVLGFEAVRAPFDITAEAEFFGCELKPSTKDQQPCVIGHVAQTPEDVEALRAKLTFGGDTRCDRIIKAIKILADKWGKELPVIGSMIGPFSLAQHLNGDDWFMNIMTEEPVCRPLLDLTTEFCIKYAEEQVKAGADTMVIIDPTASYQLLGPDFYEQWAIPTHQKIVEAMKKLNVPIVLHICGDTTEGIPLMDKAGVNGISVDQNANVAKAVEYAKTAVIVGNLDPVQCLWKGTPESIKEASEAAFKAGSAIVTAGCGIVTNSPNENLKAWAEFVKTLKY